MRTPNRKQRRAQLHPVVIRHPSKKEITLARDFEQVDQFINGLLNDEIHEQGGLIVQTVGDETYSVLHALVGWCTYWNAVAKSEGFDDYDDAALVSLVNKLDKMMPVTIEQVNAAKSVIDKQREMYMVVPNAILNQIANDVTVMVNLQDKVAA